jgi:cytochrome P450
LDFSLPYALEVVTTLVGVPRILREGMVDLMRTLLGEAGHDFSKAADAMAQFGQFVQEVLIDPRRAAGPSEDPEDIVDLLVGAEIDGRGLTDQEIRQMVVAVLNAGFETTYKTLASSLWYLAGDPEVWKSMRSGSVAFSSAFEELLRFGAPVQVGRIAKKDVTIGGQLIKAGDWVVMCLPAANRDEAEFSDAESIVLTRQPNRHLTFGSGIHRCIGMHLARLELTVAFQEVLATFERIWIPDDAEPVFSGSQAAGIISLPLAFARVA